MALLDAVVAVVEGPVAPGENCHRNLEHIEETFAEELIGPFALEDIEDLLVVEDVERPMVPEEVESPLTLVVQFLSFYLCPNQAVLVPLERWHCSTFPWQFDLDSPQVYHLCVLPHLFD